MQDETALYGAKMMQPGLTAADNEENSLRPQHLEDYIIPVAVCAVCLLDQCFIPSGNEERVHTVTLRLDADNISLPEKLFQIDFNWV